jgi:ATP-dependent exoDNAse (exonuclease V) beta subunit
VVHRAIELVARGAIGFELEQSCRAILLAEGRPAAQDGTHPELAELSDLLETLRRSALWRRSRGATHLLAEVPFLVSFPPDEARALALGEPGAVARLVEGVIDLAFREPTGGWVIVDYKTDRFPSLAARRERTAIYQRQVDLYAHCWERLTGEPVAEKVLLFTHDQSEVSWSGTRAVAQPLADTSPQPGD